MSLRSDVLHSLKWLAGARFAGQLVAWGVTIVVIRILKPSDYGLMATAGIFIGFAALFREMGLYTAMVQKRDLSRREVEQAFGMLLLCNCAVYAMLLVCAPLFASFFGDERLISMLRILGIQFPLAAVGVVQDAMLSRRMDFKHKSFVNFAVMLGNSFTTLGFALSGAGVWALVYGALAGSTIRPVGLVLVTHYWCRPRFSRKEIGNLLRFGSFVTGTRLLWYAYSRADIFIIGKLLGQETLGFYSVAMELAAMPMRKVSELLNQVGLAAYSSIQNDMPKLRSNYCKALRVLSVVSFPIFWGISSISPDLIEVALGQRWEQATLPLQLLSLIMPIRMIGHAGTGTLSAIGKPHLGTLNMFISLIMMVPAFYLAAIYGGLFAVTMVWIIVFPVVRLIQLHVALPPLGLSLRDYFLPFLGPGAAAATMYMTVTYARIQLAPYVSNGIATLVLLIAIGALTYIAFMWLLRRSDCRELLELIQRRQ